MIKNVDVRGSNPAEGVPNEIRIQFDASSDRFVIGKKHGDAIRFFSNMHMADSEGIPLCNVNDLDDVIKALQYAKEQIDINDYRP